MAAHEFMIFFLYFSVWFIKIFCMKGNGLIFCSMVLICSDAYAVNIVSSPSQLTSVVPGDDVTINNGGIYSLGSLDSVNASQITLDFDIAGGGSNPIMLLTADSGFDGVLGVPLINNVENLQIKLTDDFLSGIGGSEVFRFTNFTNTGGFINVFSEILR